jgi:hypothetical protein
LLRTAKIKIQNCDDTILGTSSLDGLVALLRAEGAPSKWWNHTFKVDVAPKTSSGAPITIVSAALSSSISSLANARVAYTGFAGSPLRKAMAE